MCAGDPNRGAREQAKIRAQEKNAAYQDAGIQYWNKEAQYLNSNQRAVLGLSRTQGDITESAIRQRGVLRGQIQLLNQAYYGISKSASQAAEAGRSRTAGRSDLSKFLARKTILENQLRNTSGANQYKKYIMANRQYKGQVATNREQLGLPPTYGSPVMMPPKGNTMMANLGMAATVAGAVMTGGASMAGTAGAFGGAMSASSAAAWGAGLSAAGPIFSSQAGGW